MSPLSHNQAVPTSDNPPLRQFWSGETGRAARFTAFCCPPTFGYNQFACLILQRWAERSQAYTAGIKRKIAPEFYE
jgi:hypothetical protein